MSGDINLSSRNFTAGPGTGQMLFVLAALPAMLIFYSNQFSGEINRVNLSGFIISTFETHADFSQFHNSTVISIMTGKLSEIESRL